MENRKVRYTKRVLREAVVELLENKRLSEITVKELCARADINRSTFYAHYQGMHELFSEMEDELMETIPLDLDATDSSELLGGYISFIRDNFKVIKAFSQDGELFEKLNDRSLMQWDEGETRTSRQRDAFTFLSRMFTAGFFDATIFWIEQNAELSVEEVTHMVAQSFDAITQVRKAWEVAHTG